MSPDAPPRRAALDVRKTYKLYIGGKFPRSGVGPLLRGRSVRPPRARFLANAALGSRKDARDAVVAARGASPGWAGATAYNRGQVLYRVAEVMEGRRAQFVARGPRQRGRDRRARPRRGVARRSTAGSGTPGGPTRSPRCSAGSTPSPGPVPVHQPSGGFQGQASDVERHAEDIIKMKRRLNEIYVRHTGQDYATIEKTLDRDYFLSAEDARTFGIVDEVITKRDPLDEKI